MRKKIRRSREVEVDGNLVEEAIADDGIGGHCGDIFTNLPLNLVVFMACELNSVKVNKLIGLMEKNIF